MPDDELALPRLDVPELPDEPATYAIRRVREVLAPTQLIAPPPPTQPREIPERPILHGSCTSGRDRASARPGHSGWPTWAARSRRGPAMVPGRRMKRAERIH